MYSQALTQRLFKNRNTYARGETAENNKTNYKELAIRTKLIVEPPTSAMIGQLDYSDERSEPLLV